MRLDNERECHWRVVFEDNNIGVGDDKAFLRSNRWDFYMNKKKYLIKGSYSVEVSGYYGGGVIWEVVDNHVVKEGKEHYEIGLRGFCFNFFGEDE